MGNIISQNRYFSENGTSIQYYMDSEVIRFEMYKTFKTNNFNWGRCIAEMAGYLNGQSPLSAENIDLILPSLLSVLCECVTKINGAFGESYENQLCAIKHEERFIFHLDYVKLNSSHDISECLLFHNT